MKAIRVYADTSVFGGVYDDEFKQPSMTFSLCANMSETPTPQ
jgi:hypothetical protein